MGKIAFLYPGQGSQKVGMGSDLLEARPEIYERYLDGADAASGLPVRTSSLEGPAETLTRTDVAQPALFALSLAVSELAQDAGLRPDYVAGHSLGEYTAAVASGALGVEDGFRLVSERGRLMNEIQSRQPGAMAAVIGLDAGVLADLCEQASEAGVVAPANVNTPAQIVVSGEEAAVERLMELANDGGAEKVVRLQVGAAFHSSLMTPVQASLGETMADVAWNDPERPLVANFSGAALTTGDEIRQALIEQIASPVLWVDCVRTLADSGCTTFLELGSGRVLTGLVRQILGPDVDAFSADSPKKLETFLASRPELVAQ
jgi:[acyl-carrier-protein] S-malonyltransferase